MKKYTLLFLIFITCLSAGMAAHAQSKYDVQDSFYFMKDGSEFTDEEKDLEAQYVYRQCQENTIRNIYFDCGCIAGAFRQERDKPILIPQDQIINSLLNDDSRGCANTVALAGETYEFCSEYAKVFRDRERDGPEYCKCVANKVAREFKRKPTFKNDNIETIRTNAMLSCDG